METKDPALTKTPIDNHNDMAVDKIAHNDTENKGTQTFQETVIGSNHASHDGIEDTAIINEDIDHKSTETFQETMIGSEHVEHNEPYSNNVEENTTVNKGTDTFEEGVIASEHVHEGDDPARQPDRRDQKGNPFDDGINEHSMRDEVPKSEGITDANRYASIDNAQTRVLNPDEKD